MELKEVIRQILEDVPEARDSDRRCICEVYKRIYPNALNSRFESVVMSSAFPSFESVTRTRRKVQAENPDLRAKKDIEKARELEESKYRKWAVS